jgi:TMEM175 potassium channel family protein
MIVEPQRPPQGGGEERDHSLPLDRFNAFSDGVFAIAITLLVLELSIPGAGVRVLPALRAQWPDFLGYFISFAFIGGIWIAHAGVTKYLKRADTESYALNLLLLLFVGLLPFSTALMVTHLTGADARFSVALYGVNLLLASVVLSLLILYLAREPSLLVDDIAEGTLRRITGRRWAALGLNVVAIAVGLVAPKAGVGLYLVETGLLLVIPFLGLRRHRRRPSAG